MVLVLTALAVGVDAYFAGLAYSIKRRLALPEILLAGSFTFLVCVPALCLGKIVSRFQFANILAALVFVYLGAKNYLDAVYNPVRNERSFGSVVALGLAVSADAALACLTLQRGTLSVLAVAGIMCLVHTLMLWLGAVSSALARVLNGITGLSGIMLIAIGLIKLI